MWSGLKRSLKPDRNKTYQKKKKEEEEIRPTATTSVKLFE